jgi:hypothetical protein
MGTGFAAKAPGIRRTVATAFAGLVNFRDSASGRFAPEAANRKSPHQLSDLDLQVLTERDPAAGLRSQALCQVPIGRLAKSLLDEGEKRSHLWRDDLLRRIDAPDCPLWPRRD